jgi:SAM-dependent methyltransferase
MRTIVNRHSEPGGTQIMGFTGERVVLGQAPERIAKDHIERYRFAARYCRGKNILDAACGTGYGCAMLKDSGANKAYGIDVCAEAITFAQTCYGTKSCDFICKNVLMIDEADFGAPINVVVSFETIEHIAEYQKLLAIFHSLLKQGGILILSTPNRIVVSPHSRSATSRPRNKFHTQEFSIEELMAALRNAGFCRSIEIYGQRLYPFSWMRFRPVWRIFEAVMDPKYFASPSVVPLGDRIARYFVIVATR